MNISITENMPAMPGMAFGYNLDPLSFAKHFNFDITQEGDSLLLTVDRYSATTEDGPDWDVDKWEEQKSFFVASPCNRHNFYELSRIGRALLNGRDVILSDGTLIALVWKGKVQ